MNSSSEHDDQPPMDGIDQLNLGRRASLSAEEVLELVTSMNDHDGRSATDSPDNSGIVRDDGVQAHEESNDHAVGEELPLPVGNVRESRRNGLVAVSSHSHHHDRASGMRDDVCSHSATTAQQTGETTRNTRALSTTSLQTTSTHQSSWFRNQDRKSITMTMAGIEDASSRRFQKIANAIEADKDSSTVLPINAAAPKKDPNLKVEKDEHFIKLVDDDASCDDGLSHPTGDRSESNQNDTDNLDIENGHQVTPRGVGAIACTPSHPVNSSQLEEHSSPVTPSIRIGSVASSNLSSTDPLVAELVPSLREQRETLRQEIRQELRDELQQTATSSAPSTTVENFSPALIEGSEGHQAEVVHADRIIEAEISDRDGDSNSSTTSNITKWQDQCTSSKRRLLWACIAIVGLVVSTVILVVLLIQQDGNNDTNQRSVDIVEPTAPTTATTKPSSLQIQTEPPTGLQTKPPTSHPSSSPSASPTIFEHDFIDQPLWIALEPILSGPPTFATKLLLANPTSVLFQTISWMLNNDTYTEIIVNTPLSASRTQKLLDRYIVTSIYFALDGQNWKNAYNFMSDFDVCNWNDGTITTNTSSSTIGVNCDDDGIVTGIALLANKLKGKLPSELYHLEKLSDLQLDQNEISGTITTYIGMLQNLTRFSVAETQLSGTIPTEIGLLTQLEVLFLHENSLSGTLPAEIGNCEALRELDLSDNQFEGTIPPEVGKLTSLNTFMMDQNNIAGTIPTEIGLLTNLVGMRLYRTDVNGTIPTEIGNLTSLEVLSWHRSDITGSIPTEIGNCKALQYFRVNLCDLVGPIPSEIGGLGNLRTLLIGRNLLTGTIPTEIGQATSLAQIAVMQTNIEGTLPTELGLLVNMKSLLFNQSPLTGTVPTELKSLSLLKEANFRATRIHGNLDPIFCNLTADDFPDLENLRADCDEGNVTCTCCTKCY